GRHCRQRAVGDCELAGGAAKGEGGRGTDTQGAHQERQGLINDACRARRIFSSQADEIPIALCRSPMARKKLSGGVVSGSIRRCRRKPSSSASTSAPAHVGLRIVVLPLFLAVVSMMSVTSFRRARSRLASSGRRFSA